MGQSYHNSRGRYLLYLTAILIPCILLGLWYLIQGHSFLAAKPYLSDELGYWRNMFSFAECGFSFGPGGGFAGYDAQIGPLGSHGLSPIFAWGWYALIFPWRENSLSAANFIMFTVSIAMFLLLVKPDRKQTLFFIVLMCLYPVTVIYIDTSMMEIPCCAAVITYSALYLRWHEKRESWAFILAVILGIYIGVLRICYILLLIPLLWESCGFRISLKTVVGVLLYIMAAVFLYWATAIFCSGYPYGFWAELEAHPDKIAFLIYHLLSNSISYFKKCCELSVEAAFRWMYLGTMLLLLIKSIFQKNGKRLYFSFFLTVFGMLAANLLLYDVGDWRDFRTLSPVLIPAVLLLINDAAAKDTEKIILSVFVLVSFALTVKTALTDEDFLSPGMFAESTDHSAEMYGLFADEPASVTTFINDFDILKDIPPQIGVQWAMDESDFQNTDTRYILAPEGTSVPDRYKLAGTVSEEWCVYDRALC